MSRYWVSWWSGYYGDEGCTEPDFQIWESGSRLRSNRPKGKQEELSLCAVIDADSPEQIKLVLKAHFPDCEMRFCEEKDADFEPNDRFPNFEGRTALFIKRILPADIQSMPDVYGILDLDLDPNTAVARYLEWGCNWSRGLDHAKACNEEAAYFKIDSTRHPPELLLVKQGHDSYTILGTVYAPRHLIEESIRKFACKSAACDVSEDLKKWLRHELDK